MRASAERAARDPRPAQRGVRAQKLQRRAAGRPASPVGSPVPVQAVRSGSAAATAARGGPGSQAIDDPRVLGLDRHGCALGARRGLGEDGRTPGHSRDDVDLLTCLLQILKEEVVWVFCVFIMGAAGWSMGFGGGVGWKDLFRGDQGRGSACVCLICKGGGRERGGVWLGIKVWGGMCLLVGLCGVFVGVMVDVGCIQDFSGFRVVVLFSRFRPNWPAPGAYDTEGRRASDKLGGQKNPLPMLLMDGKPVSAATVRW